MGLKSSYTLLAPIYDWVVASPTRQMRLSSLKRIDDTSRQHILINGIGTGLDIPHLPDIHQYTATDLTPAMLKHCRSQLDQHPLDMQLHIADVMKLPFPDHQFDCVVMNLILAVVAEPVKALQEASRVVKPGGRIYIMDKFLRPGELAPLRRFANVFIRHVATRTDVVFEELLPHCPQLKLIEDRPALFNGWFRLIELEKQY